MTPQLGPTTVPDAHTALTVQGEGDGETASVFEDEETRAFYESLPELQALVPPILLQDPPSTPSDPPNPPPQSPANERASAEEPVKADEALQRAEGGVKGGLRADGAEKEGSSQGEEDALFRQLPQCTSVEACDSFCASFCLLGRKAARKRLVSTLNSSLASVLLARLRSCSMRILAAQSIAHQHGCSSCTDSWMLVIMVLACRACMCMSAGGACQMTVLS